MSKKEFDRKNICGQNLKIYRERKALSLEQCSIALQQEGIQISSKELEEIEQGKRAVFDIEIKSFCKVLSVTVDQLFKERYK